MPKLVYRNENKHINTDFIGPHLFLVTAKSWITVDMNNHLKMKIVTWLRVGLMKVMIALKGSREALFFHQTNHFLMQRLINWNLYYHHDTREHHIIIKMKKKTVEKQKLSVENLHFLKSNDDSFTKENHEQLSQFSCFNFSQFSSSRVSWAREPTCNLVVEKSAGRACKNFERTDRSAFLEWLSEASSPNQSK